MAIITQGEPSAVQYTGIESHNNIKLENTMQTLPSMTIIFKTAVHLQVLEYCCEAHVACTHRLKASKIQDKTKPYLRLEIIDPYRIYNRLQRGTVLNVLEAT